MNRTIDAYPRVYIASTPVKTRKHSKHRADRMWKSLEISRSEQDESSEGQVCKVIYSQQTEVMRASVMESTSFTSEKGVAAG